jgi:tetratricopeptide (TPR) repeat protein
MLRAAGTRPGVVAHLVILKRDPWGYALPIALPNGGILLSKNVLDFCYQDPTRGDDRLAFVLGHEIAHQLRDDFWHLRFFQALGTATERHLGASEASAQWQALIGSPTEGRPAQELQADQHGIIYAAMAGFNTQAIVAEEPTVNFFQDWLRTRDPHHLMHQPVTRSHPTSSQRAEALMAHLQQVIDHVAVFEAGLWFYYAGDYAKAINAFTQFLGYFPGHEVYHNLAVSHHQLALQAYRLWKGNEPAIPFQLSMAIDPLTRASQIFLRQHTRSQRGTTTPATPETLFRRHLDQAIEQYRQARAHDETYTPAATNLGAALLLRGLHAQGGHRHADLYEAVATLQRALEYAPNASHTLNNLGIALFYVERIADAKSHLQQARTLAPAYAAPVFNLATIARTERLQAEAQRYQRAYEALIRQTPSEPSADSQEPEYIQEVGIGHLEDQVPKILGFPRRV